MALSANKTWADLEILEAADLNAEFTHIRNNALTLISPLTGNLDFNGNRALLDDDQDTYIQSSTDDLLDLVAQGIVALRIDGDVASPVNGFEITTSATTVAPQLAPRGTDTNIDLSLIGKGTGSVQPQRLNIPTATLTLSSGAATGTRSRHVITGEGGADDTLDTLTATNYTDGQVVYLRGASGDVITISTAGNFGEAVVLSDTMWTAFVLDGSTFRLIGLPGDVDATGAVVNTLQPAFLADSDAQSNIATGSAVDLQYGTEIFDQGGDYNTGTYTFTAAVTGPHQFNASVSLSSIDTAASGAEVNIVTSNRTYRVFGPNPSEAWSADSIWTAIGSVIADMDANDTAKVTITITGGAAQTDVINDAGFFSGALLH